MTPGLGLLLRLQVKGWLRYLGRGLSTLRGALTALVGLIVFVPWLMAVLFAPRGGPGLDPEQLGRYGPGLLLLYCLANVLFSSSDRAIYFTPAEIQFLFAGPFTRRQLLAYKLALTLMVSLPATLFMMVVIRVEGAWAPALVLGVLLLSTFMQLFTLVLGLLGSAVGASLFTRGRWLFGAVALALAALAVQQGAAAAGTYDARKLGRALLETEAWQAATLPVRSFFDLMQARGPGVGLLVPLGLAVAINLAMVAVIFALDAHFLEASAAASARMYARLQRLRGKMASVEGGPPQPAARARFGLPMPPYWGGAGPVFWRQLTTASRSLGRLLLLLFILGVAGSLMLVPMATEDDKSKRVADVIVPMLGGMAAWVTIFLTALVPFDFRGDIDRIAALKALPVRAWRLAVGQLLAPVLLLSLMQWSAVAAVAALAPGYALAAGVAALYVVPFNFVLIALENLLFLLFPVRLMANTPGDFQAVGRNVLLSLGKLFGLGLVATVAGVAVAVAWVVTRDAYLAALAGLPVVVLAGAALVPLVALAFDAFDVGRDTPA
jgi:hypothetical protein